MIGEAGEVWRKVARWRPHKRSLYNQLDGYITANQLRQDNRQRQSNQLISMIRHYRRAVDTKLKCSILGVIKQQHIKGKTNAANNNIISPSHLSSFRISFDWRRYQSKPKPISRPIYSTRLRSIKTCWMCRRHDIKWISKIPSLCVRSTLMTLWGSIK